MKKIKFFLIGLVPGLIIVFFVLNKKGVSCSGYLPNSRVIAETLSKDFTYSDQFKAEMTTLKINEKFLKDSIITLGKIDFDRSHAQKKPCPDYVITYPEKNPVYEVTFEKCEEKAVLNNLKKLK
ncbi:hypothetical protein IX39_17100 [Chryseobacterium formosense]|uniref:DUF4258 domain-containing protein n=1 Tax=Chryseobacterium formosense TaxID=236814 RepID=A0A085Z0Z9_9FLAO|nr:MULTISPECIES: hypothetical protein [Chryseobacterium]KFE98112.1 hypothetical protein IX39_17100 [Chryseobacterium formosense]OCK50974.1 hypothetical protein BA768_04100 [Chryseobacterium sp. CBo1]SFT73189.1 hypothetical protein SAMN05421857_2825 [Chryseobacterium formosense]